MKAVADGLMKMIGVIVRWIMVIKMMIKVANGDSSEDEVTVIDSKVEDENALYEISGINVTLQWTTKCSRFSEKVHVFGVYRKRKYNWSCA